MLKNDFFALLFQFLTRIKKLTTCAGYFV